MGLAPGIRVVLVGKIMSAMHGVQLLVGYPRDPLAFSLGHRFCQVSQQALCTFTLEYTRR